MFAGVHVKQGWTLVNGLLNYIMLYMLTWILVFVNVKHELKSLFFATARCAEVVIDALVKGKDL